MALSEEEITRQLEAALAELAQTRGKNLADALRPILVINQSRHRITKFIGNGTVHTVQDYVLRVADGYAELHGYIDRIQVKRDELEWGLLLQKMEQMARGYL